jgi:hypothetical protein
MQPHKYLGMLLALSVSVLLYADNTPTIIARSQGRTSPLKVAGLSGKVHLTEQKNYVNLDATAEYGQTFRSHRIARSLFGDDVTGASTILVQGSSVANRDARAWLADYFYLPPDYNSYFCVQPKVQTFAANLDLFVGLDEVLQGLYFRAHGPITWSKWSLNFDEPCSVITTGSYSAGYFDTNGMANAQLLHTFGEYASGNAPLAVAGPSALANLGFVGSVSFEGLSFAQIERCARTRTGFADLRLELGYDFLQSDNYHLGVNVQVVAPAGSRREARFAFDSVIGNGNHWEVGGGLTGHYTFWKCDDETKTFSFYVDASVTHINNAREQRTFDLCGRPNSRYMLAEKVATPVNLLRATSQTTDTGLNNVSTPIAQFQGVFAPVANLTTLDVYVRADLQADISAMFNFTCANWGVDLGYNFWTRTREKINLRGNTTSDCCPSLCTQPNTWALKGDARVFGFLTEDLEVGDVNLPQNTPVALSATECGATIHQGTNATATNGTHCAGSPTLQNCGIDTPLFAFAFDTAFNEVAEPVAHSPNLTAVSDLINTSVTPKFINCCDINLQATKGMSNSFFANANYTWDRQTWKPYLGIGGQVEFGSHSNSNDSCSASTSSESTPACSTPCDPIACCQTNCSDAMKCSLSQWAVWLKGGVNFD